MLQRNRVVHLAGSTVACSTHACAFFHNPEEEERVLLPFFKEGLEAGDRFLHILRNDYRPARRGMLGDSGIDLAMAERTGQVELRPWEEAYLRGSRFDQDAMLDLVQQVLSDGKESGFGLTRLWANMEWALEDLPGVEDLVEYEARANYMLPKYDAVVVCTYDIARFSAAMVMDILRTHPEVIIGETLQRNPFYVGPDAFLKELRGRRQTQEAAPK
jgi:MEDS: MEthanogen/methylotroph, DcmR Sensory domain